MSNNNIRILSEPISYQELITHRNIRISGIYKIENLIDHKVYIGQSRNAIVRLKHHVCNCKNEHLRNAFIKYGFDNFSFEIIKQTYDLDYWEIFLIQIYDATNKEHGYNIAPGGLSGDGNWIYLPEERQAEIRVKISKANKGKIVPEEQRVRISKVLSGRPSPNKGRILSDERRLFLSQVNKERYKDENEHIRTSNAVKNSEKYQASRRNPEFRKRMSEVNKGRKVSDETKHKISKAHLGTKMPKEFGERMSEKLRGRKLSEDWKRKISESHKGKSKDYIQNTYWWNDGIKNYRSQECPFEGCVKGRIRFNNVGSKGMKWWNNGVVEVLSKECPQGFWHGKLPMKEETKKKLSEYNKNKHKH